MMNQDSVEYPSVDPRRRWLRVIGILEACDWCSLTPVSTPTLHAIAYLADALAPVWSIDPLDAVLIKQTVGPYYPNLQHDVDRLIGMGLVEVKQLSVSAGSQGDSFLQARYQLNKVFASRILHELRTMPDEANVLAFLGEVVQAFSRLADDQLALAMEEDATYGDPQVDTGEVIDLGEWVKATSTPSARAAKYMESLVESELAPAETIELYVNHLIRRVTHAVA